MNSAEFLERTDFIGGDVEGHEGQDVYRGPIEKIELVDGMIVVTSPWVAIMDPAQGWRKYRGQDKVSFNAELLEVQDIGQGRAMVFVPAMGPLVFFPKGGSKLDPAEVSGLDEKDIKACL